MNTDSMIMRALAEVAFNGYTDQNGNHVNTMSQIMSQFKPSDEFYQKLEKKIDMEVIAEKIVDDMSSIGPYNRELFQKRIREQAEKIVAEKLAEKMITEYQALQNNK